MRFALLLTMVLSLCGVAYSQPMQGKSDFDKEVTAPIHPLQNLEPGHWAKLGKNTLYDVRYVPEPGGRPIKTIMSAWSGAAYNSDLNQLWVHGGGHGDGADNAVYAFDVDSLTWYRSFDPSTRVTGHTGRYYLDGKPAAVHSQDYVEYLPSLSMMVIAGARGPFPGVTAHLTTDAVDSEGCWIRLQDVPSCEHPTAAVHPKTGILWQHGGEGSGFLSSFDPVLGLWCSHGKWNTDNIGGATRTSSIDPVHDKFVVMNVGAWGDNSIWIWDIEVGHSGREIAGVQLNMTGDTEILFVSGPPGLDWHARRQKLYAWHGGIHIYEIDVMEELITKVQVSPDNKIIPTPGTYNGVYGRWRYVEEYNVFMGVNAVDESVYFFRLPQE